VGVENLSDIASMINLGKAEARTDFFERASGYRKRGVAIRTNWAKMRIAENAWRTFATAAKRLAF
jgi:hypothetical protein